VKTALRDMIRYPEGRLREPLELVERPDLTHQEKLAVLQSWQTDLVELQKAAEENMEGTGPLPGGSGARLAQVMEAIAILREREAQGSH
jgi:hypothetical protein